MFTLEQINLLNNGNPFAKYCEMEMTEVGEDFITGRMPYKKEYQNNYGSMHGGSVYALADTIGGLAALNASGHYVTTIEGHLNYALPSMNTEYVNCTAKVMHAGNKVVATEVKIYGDDGTVFCFGTFNFYNLSGQVDFSEI